MWAALGILATSVIRATPGALPCLCNPDWLFALIHCCTILIVLIVDTPVVYQNLQLGDRHRAMYAHCSDYDMCCKTAHCHSWLAVAAHCKIVLLLVTKDCYCS